MVQLIFSGEIYYLVFVIVFFSEQLRIGSIHENKMYTIYFKVVSSLTKRRQLQTRLSTNTGYSIGCNRAYSLDSKMGACKFSISWKYFPKFYAAEPDSVWWFDLKLDTHHLDQLLFLDEDHKTILHLTRTGICSAV